MSAIHNLLERVKSPGAFREWRHPRELNESSLGTIDLSNLASSSRMVYDHSKVLMRAMMKDDHGLTARAAFAIMQNLFPIVEALDPDAAKYLAQAAEKLRQ
jgi:hypothetical protein